MTSPGRRWVWYGGRPSLDFVNTRRNRGAGPRDGAAEYLREPADFAAWLMAAGLASPHGAGSNGAGPGGASRGGASPHGASPGGGSPLVDEETFAGALALREAINAGVTATVAGRSVPEQAVRCVNEWIAAEPQRPALCLAAGVPVLSVPRAGRTPRGALALIAADAAELLGTGLRERLRICPGPGCQGRFLDDSPAGRRRWCSMAVCGNRSKAAAHRQAAQAAAGRP
jgi:predicted RNA-binding Zn ribbon-like protein